MSDDRITLSLEDIQNAVALIDYAATQGTYKGWETINAAFGVRQKLNTYVEQTKAEFAKSTPVDTKANLDSKK